MNLNHASEEIGEATQTYIHFVIIIFQITSIDYANRTKAYKKYINRETASTENKP